MRARALIKRHSSYHVYMLRCADGMYYTGYTSDVEARVKLHNSGHGAKSLNWKGKLPVALVYAKAYRYYKRVLQAEQHLKKLRRKKKEELIQQYAEHERRRTERWAP
jgi:putative endonuclease